MRVSTNGLVSRSELEWRKILSRFQSSGLSIKEYCDQEQLLASSHRRWQRKLTPKSKPAFIPITKTTSTSPAWSMTVSLPNGCQLRFEG
jgi:hypothetical protein